MSSDRAPESHGGSVPPPASKPSPPAPRPAAPAPAPSPPAPAVAESTRAGAGAGAGESVARAPTPTRAPAGDERLTAAQAEAVARVAAMAAERPAAAEGGLSRAATVALVGLGVLVFAMVLLALLLS